MWSTVCDLISLTSQLPLEQKIAYAIKDVATEHFLNLNEFCEAYGFTEEQFEQFLQDAIDTAESFRRMDEYYVQIQEVENVKE